MIDEKYLVKASRKNRTFEFVSTGPKGNILKVVDYTKIDEYTYNLGFGDKNSVTGEISDIVVTNNNDSKKVLQTVAATLYAFTNTHPYIKVFVTGSTFSRTRLYQIGISNNLVAIRKDFYIYGLKAGEWEPFEVNCQYEGFLVERKIKFE